MKRNKQILKFVSKNKKIPNYFKNKWSGLYKLWSNFKLIETPLLYIKNEFNHTLKIKLI